MTDEVEAGHDERSDAVRELEREFGVLFTQMRRLYAEVAERFSPGMLPGTYKVFSMIAHHGPATAGSLGERLHVDKSQMSRTIRELEELGFIQRSPDPADGRVSIITATDAGRERLEIARGSEGNRLARTLDSWQVDDIRKLAQLLRQLASSPAG